MSYSPITDFLALLRQTSGGVRTERMPGLDYVVDALARAGLISLSIGQTAPTVNQSSTAWFKPAVPSWSAEGVLYLWDAGTAVYEIATPVLWAALLGLGGASNSAMRFPASSAVIPIIAADTEVGIDTSVTAVNAQLPSVISWVAAHVSVVDLVLFDYKGHADVRNITPSLNGSDTFIDGSLPVVVAQFGTLRLRPMVNVPGAVVNSWYVKGLN